ncbi:hypothetical protein EW146_g7907 [Bondarzewia mesenterica]|uniref:BRCT domain-containing protein n=1 Tax=Bondarzewia mesenterica TaxID=1095465 RepID=A0A4S4LIF5_9AGAM|nr:hypothetical protein EW146_g7907 [Bondarzewia mesenterica]
MSTLDTYLDRSKPLPEPLASSQEIRDRASTFVANIFRARSPGEAQRALTHLKRVLHGSKPASHEIAAWRCMVLKPGRTGFTGNEDFEVQEGSDDDRENWAGGRVLKVMQAEAVIDAVVIVSRWYGGTMLGPVRFMHIETCAREVCRAFRLQDEIEDHIATLQTLDDLLSDLRAQLSRLKTSSSQTEGSISLHPENDSPELIIRASRTLHPSSGLILSFHISPHLRCLMPFKRPASPTGQPLSSSSSRSHTPIQRSTSKRPRLSAPIKSVLKGVKIHILQAKLNDSDIAELFTLVGKCGARLCPNVYEADVIVTGITMRKRLERHIDWDTAKSKSIVTPAWLRETARRNMRMPCEEYSAVRDLQPTTLANCPSTDDDDNLSNSTLSRSSSPQSIKTTQQSSSVASFSSIPANLLPPEPPPTPHESLDSRASFACLRASPLTCVNQELCEQLDVMRRTRELEGEDRSSLSYRRAVSIEEYIEKGSISEVQTTLNSPRFHALTAFSSIYGIGPVTARSLYALNLRTIEDLEKYYEVDIPSSKHITDVHDAEHAGNSIHQGTVMSTEDDNKDLMNESWIKIALGLRHDLSIKIPRAEVEEIHRVIMAELEHVQPGCVSTIVGGYRRGKLESNDVDIVFTHPETEKVQHLCKRLMTHLHKKGLVTHVMHLSSFHEHNALRTTHWDSLEKALTVFVLPSSQSDLRLRRRVDFIFAHPQTYWTAVVGWTGSTMFERDLRLWAKKRGLKFDSSGITRRRDSKLIYPRTEKEVFDILGLPWIEPTMRNADV